MTDLQIYLARWLDYANDIANLDTLHFWAAFQDRELIRQALAAGATFTEHESAALALGDDLFDEHSEEVCSLMDFDQWLDTIGPEHYAAEFYRRHRGMQTDADN